MGAGAVWGSRPWQRVAVVVAAVGALIAIDASAALVLRPRATSAQEAAALDWCPDGTRRFAPTAPGQPWSCAHLDEPPAGVDVTEPASTAEVLRRDGAAETVTAVAEAEGAAPSTVAASPTSVTCEGDGVAGHRVQAVYAYDPTKPAGLPGGDRYPQLLPVIQQWAAGVDTVYNRSAALTGGYRAVRWVTEPDGAGGCRVAVTKVAVTASEFAGDAVLQGPLARAGLNRTDRKYLTWADASVLCGVGQTYNRGSLGGRYGTAAQNNLNNGFYAMYGRVDQQCWGYADSTEAHELLHMLGGVLDNAPHASAAGHCDDESDLMCYDDDGSGPVVMRDVCPPGNEVLLDCNGDDYYSTYSRPGSFLATHWNTADSRYLIGGGTGTVGGTAGVRGVELYANDGVAGLATQATASVRVPDGTPYTSAFAVSPAASCVVAATDDQAQVRCRPSVASARVTTTVTDAGGTTSASSRVTLSRAARPATLTTDSPWGGQVWACLPSTLPVRARLVDTATGAGVYGATVQFRQGGATIATALTDVDGLAHATPSVSIAGTITAQVTDAGWAGAQAVGGVQVASDCATDQVRGTVADTSVLVGDTVTVTGSAISGGVRSGVSVRARFAGQDRDVVTDAAGQWTASWTGVTTGGQVTGRVGASSTAVLGTVTVAPWTGALTATSAGAQIGQPAVIAGTLERTDPTSTRRAAVPGILVSVAVDDWTGTATTLADGSWQVTTPVLTSPTVFTATTAATADLTAAEVSGGIAVAERTSTLTLTGPSRVYAGSAVTVGGRVSVGEIDGTLTYPAGESVAVTVVRDATPSTTTVTTDGAGRWSLALGALTVGASAGEATVSAALLPGSGIPAAPPPAPLTITVDPMTWTTSLSWTAVPTQVGHGTSAALRGFLVARGADGRAGVVTGGRVTVTTVSGGRITTAATTVAADGSFTTTVGPLTAAATVTARFAGTSVAGAVTYPAAQTPSAPVAVGAWTAAPVITSSPAALLGTGTVTVSGTATKSYGATRVPLAGTAVTVMHVDGKGVTRAVGRATTDAAGRFTVRGTVMYRGTLRADVAAATGLLAGRSPVKAIAVAVRSTMTATATTVTSGATITFGGGTSPVRGGYPMTLQRWNGSAWKTMGRASTTRVGRVSLPLRMVTRGTAKYRWVGPTDVYTTTGTSAHLSITVR